MSAHTCHWPGCRAETDPRRYACRRHWYTLPKWLRDAIWGAYRVNQELDKRPSREYLAVTSIARLWGMCYDRIYRIKRRELGHAHAAAFAAREWFTTRSKTLDDRTPDELIRDGLGYDVFQELEKHAGKRGAHG